MCTPFSSSSYNNLILYMLTNYISGLPSHALHRAEQFALLLKINLDIDIYLSQSILKRMILQRIMWQSAHVLLGSIYWKILYIHLLTMHYRTWLSLKHYKLHWYRGLNTIRHMYADTIHWSITHLFPHSSRRLHLDLSAVTKQTTLHLHNVSDGNPEM